jgi:dTDP-glucose 4,6-dehydratase
MEWKDKKVLVTGGAGFIGSHLVEKLIEYGSEVTVADIKNKENLKNLNHIVDSINFVECDVTNPDSLKKIGHMIEYIFHLAALANPRDCDANPDLAFKINVIGTLNVLNLAKQNKIKKFIFTSSAQLYGKNTKVPINESHPIEPEESIYSSTKRMGEELCILFNKRFDTPTVFLRLFNTFGPRQSVDYFIPTVISQALNKGFVELWNDKPTRDFIFVDDTVMALIRAAEADFRGGPVNIGCGREINVGDLGRRIASDLNAEIKFLNKGVTGPVRLLCNNSMAKKVFGWSPKVKFEDGLKSTIDWFKKNN